MGKRRNLDAVAGVLVTGVRPGGPAASARPEIEAGAVITAVDGKPVSSVEDLLSAAAAGKAGGKPLVLRLEINGEQRLSLVKPVFGDQARDPLPELPKSWVGAEVQPFTGSLAKEIGLATPGFRVSRLYPGSPLAAAGAKVGDLLVAMDGQPLKPGNDISAEDFDQQVHDLTVGTKARFSALREGKPVAFEVAVSPSPVDTSGLRTLAVARLRAQLRELGFYDRVAMKLATDREGVFIDGVESGGAAGLAHLRRGDVIVSLGERRVNDPAALSAALEQALAAPGTGMIPLQVIRGNQVRIMYLERYWLNVDGPEAR
jgi:serine protease Do